MSIQKIDGEGAILMIYEMLNDIDDDTLARILSSVLDRPVRVLGDDEFEITWK